MRVDHYLEFKSDGPVSAGASLTVESDPAPEAVLVGYAETFGGGLEVERCGGRRLGRGERLAVTVRNVRDYPMVLRGRLVCEATDA